jgi:bifunctional non-homologous end joining protein LigD
MGLSEYNKKRHFDRTPEPAGKRARSETGHSFVIQKHAATRLHYDFRLELDGTLKSWAVPKGPSLDPAEKRLAVEVEDHPISYAGFEGNIPKGEYGGGSVIVWDRGDWEPVGDPREGLKKGSLKFTLNGDKLHGRFALVRMKGRDTDAKPSWLLLKEKDAEALPGSGSAIVDERPESVVTGRTVEDVAADREAAVWHSNREEKPKGALKRKIAAAAASSTRVRERPTTHVREKPTTHVREKRHGRTVARDSRERPSKHAKIEKNERSTTLDLARLGAKRAALPETVEPELATLVDHPPKGESWLHEVKFDGYRTLVRIDRGKVSVFTRRGQDWTDHFPTLASAAAELPVDRAILDGEAVVLRGDGSSDFQALQNAFGSVDSRVRYFAFDLLHLDGQDLRAVPLRDRKALLREIFKDVPDASPLGYSDHVEGDGDAVYAAACRMGLEGTIAKLADSPYVGGRGKRWLKIKCCERQELVVGGYTEPQGGRAGVGALLLGVNEPGRGLVYVGKVGTGFDNEMLRLLRKRLEPTEITTCPFVEAPQKKGSHWVKPKMVVEVSFTAWTNDGKLRHPSFQGIREDKTAAEVVREKPVPAARAAREAKTDESPHVVTSRKGASEEIAGVRISNPDKVLYPEAGITKAEIARYYESIAEETLEHLADRPLTLVRCPEGHGRFCFFQKHPGEGLPKGIHTKVLDRGDEPYLYVRSLEGLLGLVQLGALELHVWGSRIATLEKPDFVVFDLDPDEALDFSRVVDAAREVRDLLEELDLQSFVKTTGGKGLHVVVPLQPKLDWDETKAFTKSVAEALVARAPDRYTAILSKAKRRGKIFVDYLRNGRGATAIAPFSTRARPNATVAYPVRWQDLDDLDPRRFTVRTVPALLAKRRSDPWKGFSAVRQSITPAMERKLRS